MANTVIQLKKSSTPGSSPSSGNLANGELAINFADGVIYYKNLVGQVAQFTAPGKNYGTVNANGTLLVSGIAGDVFTILPGQNITVVGDAVNDRVTIGADLTSANGWANTKLSNGTVTLAGALTTTGSIYANGVIYVTPVGGQEGGEIKLQATGSNTNWNMDSYQNNFRLFAESGTTVSNVNFFHAIGGGSIRMGVNRADPGYTLDVNGIVNASAIYVNGAPMSSGSMDYPYANLVGSSANAASSANDASQGANIAVLAASFVSNSQSLSANVNTLAATFASANANNISLSANVNVLAAVAAAALANTSGVSFNGNLNFPTGNVGIGNTSPSGQLTLDSATANRNGIHFRATGWNSIGRLGFNGTSGGELIQSYNWNANAGTVDDSSYATSYVKVMSGYLIFGTAGTNTVPVERMRIDYDGIVRIGSTSGAGAGEILSANGFAVIGKTGSNPRVLIGDTAAGTGVIGTLNNYLVEFRVNNTERMRIDTSGNVAIGQASAPERLTVFRDTDNSAEVGRAHIGYVGYNDYAGFSHVDMNGAGNYALLQQSTGQTYLNSASGTPIYFRHGNGDQMTLSAGNLGIGTTAPDTFLHIYKGNTAAHQNFIKIEMPSWSGSAGYNKNIVWSDGAGAVAGIGAYFDGTSVNFSFHSMYNGGLKTNANSVMNIMGTGNVGIGTTSPAYKLDVAGTINALSTAGDGNGIRVTATAGYDSWINLYRQGYVNWYFGTINNSTRLDIKNDSLTAMSIAGSTGYVGIGTTAPSANLHVIGTANVSSTLYTRDIEAQFYSLYNEAAGIYVGIKGNYLRFGGTSEFMRIANTSGYVGIGTTAPSERLHVANGHILINNNYGLKTIDDLGNTRELIITGTDGTTYVRGFRGSSMMTGVNGATYLYDSGGAGTIRVSITATGNVGIGTSTPSATLHVQGNANIALPNLVVGGTNVIAAIVAANANAVTLSSNVNTLAASFVSNSQSLSANVNTLAATFASANANTISLSANLNVLAAAVVANDASQGANIATLAASFVSNSQTLSANVNTLAANVNTLAGAAYPKTGGTISGDVTVTGSLTVSGATTYVNTQTLLIGDNLVTLNADLPGNVQPTENAGLEINRGARTSNAAFIWNENANSWQFTSNTLAGVYSIIASQTDANNVGAAANNFAAATYLTQSAFASANANNVSLSANVNVLAASFVSNSQTLAAYTTIVGASANSYASANYITSSGNISGYSGSIFYLDNRQISPSEDSNNRLKFGFTSWNNDGVGPYADYLHTRSYSDSSGGNDNLIVFRKDQIGMRIWQQTFSNTSPYATYKDVAFTTDVSGVFNVLNVAYSAANTNAASLSANVNTLAAAVVANDASQGANIATLAAAFVSNSQSLSANVNTLAAALVLANTSAHADIDALSVVANAKVSSVTGTSGRITSSGGTTPAIDLATAGAGAATYSSGISAVTVDAYGRVTSVTGSAGYLTSSTGLANTSGVSFNGNLNFPTGNVGIGTTSPQTRLQVGTKVNDDATYTYDINTFMAVHQTPTGTTTLNDPKTVMMLARQGTGGQAYGAAVAFDLSRYENAGTSGVGSRTRLDITLANNNFIAQNTTVMTLLSGGNVGIGITSPLYKLHVNGSFAANTKSFVIDHPTKPGMKLRYGSLEGPENGVYVRGKIEGNVIELPDYWTGLVHEDTITVQLTAIGRSQSPYVVEIKDNKVHIDTENHTQPYCFYHIYGERKDVEKLVVEY